MKKKIYAVKSGRKTGIFKEWSKCSEQINKYLNSKFRHFEYRSEFEEEPEDMPGSLRHAIKEAEEYLGNLVYLGENTDYLEEVSWEEEGFLPFGNELRAEKPEFSSDKREDDKEDIKDIDEEHDEWLIDNKNTHDALPESWEIESWDKREDDEEDINESWETETKYWKIAEDMKKCIELIKHGRSDTEKRTAASDLKRHLENCLADVNLSDLTAIYKDLKEKNVIGYNPPAVAKFVMRLANRYPKP